VEDLSPPPQRTTNITVCAIFRNEARDLFEWVTYHWLLGVDHFVLYDNESTDAQERVLAPFIEKGIVTVKHRAGKKSDHPTPQLRAMADCKRQARRKRFSWLALFDIDEFLVLRGAAANACVDPRRDGSWSSALHAALAAMEEERVGAVLADRDDFGTNGLRSRNKHQIQSASFIRRSAMRSIHGKPLMMLKALKPMNSFAGFHDVRLAKSWSVKRSCKAGSACAFDFFHYKTRSLTECVAKSMDPRLPKRNWRCEVGSTICQSMQDSAVPDTLASSNLLVCVAENAERTVWHRLHS
jgi:hypothetical protein